MNTWNLSTDPYRSLLHNPKVIHLFQVSLFNALHNPQYRPNATQYRAFYFCLITVCMAEHWHSLKVQIHHINKLTFTFSRLIPALGPVS